MPPYDINRFARETARDSDFEHMMWYAFYIITEGLGQAEKDDIMSGISDIVDSANTFHFSQMKIYEFKLTSFVLIMDDIHLRIARDRTTFESYTQLFFDCLQALLVNDLIDINPMGQLRVDPGYYSKYWAL